MRNEKFWGVVIQRIMLEAGIHSRYANEFAFPVWGRQTYYCGEGLLP